MTENLSQDPRTEVPRRLTRVERARLEALKSFGCEDFGSVMQSARKVSLKSKLTVSKGNPDVRRRSKEVRRKSGRRSSLTKPNTQIARKRLTKTELAKIEALKSFQNHNLADITNSSKRIVSKFLNKSQQKKFVNKHCKNEEAETSRCGTKNISQENSKELQDKQESPADKIENADLGTTINLQTLFDTNEKVLKTAKSLDEIL